MPDVLIGLYPILIGMGLGAAIVVIVIIAALSIIRTQGCTCFIHSKAVINGKIREYCKARDKWL